MVLYIWFIQVESIILDNCFDRLKLIRNRVVERCGLKVEEIYLKVFISRKGILNICSILRIIILIVDEVKDDLRICIDMIIFVVSRVFLVLMWLMMVGV